MNVFFCDIRGTFDGSLENREEMVISFVNNLSEIANELEIDDLVFRFITSDNMEYLLSFVKELNKYTDGTKIRLTSQFSERQKYKNGEIIDIPYHNKLDKIRYISEGKDIRRIFFADDCKQTNHIIQEVLPILCPNSDIISFIPSCKDDILGHDNIYTSTKSGIEGLNESLCTYKNSIRTNNKVFKKV